MLVRILSRERRAAAFKNLEWASLNTLSGRWPVLTGRDAATIGVSSKGAADLYVGLRGVVVRIFAWNCTALWRCDTPEDCGHRSPPPPRALALGCPAIRSRRSRAFLVAADDAVLSKMHQGKCAAARSRAMSAAIRSSATSS